MMSDNHGLAIKQARLAWLLMFLQAAVLTSISVLGPFLGSIAVAGCLFVLACLTSMPGFTALTISMSQITEVPGLAEGAVFALKWSITGVILGLVMARMVIERRSIDFKIELPERLLLVMALWGGVCAVFAVHKLSSLADALRIAAYPVLVVVVRETLRTRRSIMIAVSAYGLAAAIGIGYSLFGPSQGVGRFEGFSGNPNSFGLFLSFTVPVLVAGYFASRGFLLHVMLLSSGALSAVALLLSWSRASLLSLAVQGVVAATLFKKTRLLAISSALVLGLIVAVLLTPRARDLVFATFRLQGGTTHRTVVWSAGAEQAFRSPIVGYGSGLTVDEVAPNVAWADWSQAFALKSVNAPFLPHNLYLHTALTAGLPGLALLGLLVWTLCRRHLTAGRAAASRELRIAHYTIVAMVFGSLANGMFESTALIGKGAVNNYFWIAVGIVAALEKIARGGASTEGTPTEQS